MGAKNHCVIMPDGEDSTWNEASPLLIHTANRNLTLNAVAGAAFGAAGQRCMALSVGTFGCRSRRLQY